MMSLFHPEPNIDLKSIQYSWEPNCRGGLIQGSTLQGKIRKKGVLTEIGGYLCENPQVGVVVIKGEGYFWRLKIMENAKV